MYKDLIEIRFHVKQDLHFGIINIKLIIWEQATNSRYSDFETLNRNLKIQRMNYTFLCRQKCRSGNIFK